mmetsp:Transcript_119617/g.371863  ORF Transcript_119617/g.371863 Transcript_119617/m.371863 type:complete len:287 (+) Transcript_119617:1150-2010(+)
MPCRAWMARCFALRLCSCCSAMRIRLWKKSMKSSSSLMNSTVWSRTCSMRWSRPSSSSCSSRSSSGMISCTASRTCLKFSRPSRSLRQWSTLRCKSPCRRRTRTLRATGTRPAANSAKSQPTLPFAFASQSFDISRRSAVLMHCNPSSYNALRSSSFSSKPEPSRSYSRKTSRMAACSASGNASKRRERSRDLRLSLFTPAARSSCCCDRIRLMFARLRFNAAKLRVVACGGLASAAASSRPCASASAKVGRLLASLQLSERCLSGVEALRSCWPTGPCCSSRSLR